MNFKVEYLGKIIAEFENCSDAILFLDSKRKLIYHSCNSVLLDRIAEENGLDRNDYGAFTRSLCRPYYISEKERIERECRLIEESEEYNGNSSE